MEVYFTSTLPLLYLFGNVTVAVTIHMPYSEKGALTAKKPVWHGSHQRGCPTRCQTCDDVRTIGCFVPPSHAMPGLVGLSFYVMACPVP